MCVCGEGQGVEAGKGIPGRERGECRPGLQLLPWSAWLDGMRAPAVRVGETLGPWQVPEHKAMSWSLRSSALSCSSFEILLHRGATLSDFRKTILTTMAAQMGREKIGSREPCSAKIMIIQATDDEGLSEGRSVEMRTKWIRE